MRLRLVVPSHKVRESYRSGSAVVCPTSFDTHGVNYWVIADYTGNIGPEAARVANDNLHVKMYRVLELVTSQQSHSNQGRATTYS